jgi:hypothetical protein
VDRISAPDILGLKAKVLRRNWLNVLHQQLPLGGICYVGFDDPKLCRQRQSLRAFDQMHFSASHFCP